MVALLSMTGVMAQTRTDESKAPKRMTHEEMTTQMSSRLNLTDAQKTQVAALNKEYQDYLMPQPLQQSDKGQTTSSTKGKKADKKGQKGSEKPTAGSQIPAADSKKQGAGSQNQAKRQEYEKKLKAILSSDQYQSYQAMRPQGKDAGTQSKKAQSKQGKAKKN